MSWSIEFAPIIPWQVLWAAAGAAFAIALFLLVRGRSGAVVRALALAALVGALANPTLKQEERDPLSNIVVVVRDDSHSQRIDNRRERTAAITKQLEERFAKIPNLEVKWVEATSRGDGNEGTRLFSSLERALANIPADRLAGVVMVTDGRVHDVPKSAAALGFEAPVHALLTGRRDEFDRRVKVLRAPRYGIVDTTQDAEIMVESTRAEDVGQVVRLRIRRQGQPDETIIATIGTRVTIPIPFPHAGKNIVEVDMPPTEGELTPDNNRIIIAAEGVRENLRVLLVSGEPHAGERTWRNLLKSDAAVDLVHFTILRPPEKQDGTPIHQLSLIAFPTRELFSEKLHDFDLIIFDRYQRRGVLPILYLDNVSRYVEEHGGAVLVAAGKDFADSLLSLHRTPLSQVLPAEPTGRVIEQPYRAKITRAGSRHPVTRALPGSAGAEPKWGRWFRLIEANAQSGNVIMEGADERPLLVLDRRGKGRVALLLSDHAWLWARGLEGGGPHTQLLRRLAHWLMKEPDLEEEYLNATAEGLTIKIERRTMKDSVAPVTVTGPDGERREVTLTEARAGLWSATAEVERPGLYQLMSEDNLSAVVHAGSPNSREMTEVTASGEPLGPVLEGSGGGAFWAGESSMFGGEGSVSLPRISMLRSARIMHGSGWLGLRDRNAYVTRGVNLTPLFNGFAALALLLGLIAAAWWREGR